MSPCVFLIVFSIILFKNLCLAIVDIIASVRSLTQPLVALFTILVASVLAYLLLVFVLCTGLVTSAMLLGSSIHSKMVRFMKTRNATTRNVLPSPGQRENVYQAPEYRSTFTILAGQRTSSVMQFGFADLQAQIDWRDYQVCPR